MQGRPSALSARKQVAPTSPIYALEFNCPYAQTNEQTIRAKTRINRLTGLGR